MKKVLSILIALSTVGFTSHVSAETLLDVYEQARTNNPDLKKSETQRNAAYEKINEARGGLLPSIGLNGNYQINHGQRSSKDINQKQRSLSLALTQPLFDFSLWKNYTITQKMATIQDVTYRDQQQQLILNTSVSYFNVLKSLDTVSTVTAKKKAIYRQLEQTRQRYQVGLLPIMDVQNAQAEYDLTTAEEVNAKNSLDNALEDLRQISGRYYDTLSTIDTHSFKTEIMSNVTELLTLADSNNLTLLATRLNKDVSKEQIQLANSAHLPTLSLSAGASLSRNKNYGERGSFLASGESDDSINGGQSIGAKLSFPIFAGGQVMSRAKQAQHNYAGSIEQLESVKRTVEKQVRSSYNNIIASISAIKAYEQSVVSAESSLKATQSSYDVGTRTIVDVLNATTQLYNARQKLSDSKYNYLISLLQLKGGLGTLNHEDLVYLNSMLGKQVQTEYNMAQ